MLIAAIMVPSAAFGDSIITQIDSTTYDIEYTGNNIILKSAISDTDFISIIFETEVTSSEGYLSIVFERDFFDAKIGTEIDDEFFILADGYDEIQFSETKNDTARTLSFSVSAGTEEIEIFGTILANNSFLLEKAKAEAEAQAEAQAEAEAEAQAEAQAKAEAQAEAEAQAQAKAEAKAEAQAKLDEEQKLEKLMNSCGEGTIFENGECVLSPMAKNASDTRTGPLIYSIVIGMSLGIIIMLILWGIGKKSHKVLSDNDS